MIHNRSKLTPWPLPRHALLHSQRPHQRSLSKTPKGTPNIARGKSTGQLSKSKYMTWHRYPGIFANTHWSDFPTANIDSLKKSKNHFPGGLRAWSFFILFQKFCPSTNMSLVPGSIHSLHYFGMVIPPLAGILIFGISTPNYYWVDDHSLWK